MRLYFVRVEIEGCLAEVFLNGAPLAASSRRGTIRNLLQVNHWVIEGLNTLEVQVSQTLPTRQPTAEAGPTGLTVTFGRGDESHLSGEVPFDSLASITERTPPEGDVASAHTRRATAEVQSPFPQWRWQRAERLATTADVRRDAAAFVSTIYEIVRAKDLAHLETLVSLSFEEVAPAYGQLPDAARSRFRERYQWLFEQADFALVPFEPHELDFRPCCDNRLLQVRTRSGQPAIRHQGFDAKGGWFLPLMIGRVDGKWSVLR